MSEAQPAAEAVKFVTGADGAAEPTVEALRVADVQTLVRMPSALEQYADQLRHMLCSIVKQFGGRIDLSPQKLDADAVVVLQARKSGRATLVLSNMRDVTAARLRADAEAATAALAGAQAAFDEKGAAALRGKDEQSKSEPVAKAA